MSLKKNISSDIHLRYTIKAYLNALPVGEYRNAKKLLAKRMKIDRSMLDRYIRDTKKDRKWLIDFTKLKVLGEYFGVDPWTFVDEIDRPRIETKRKKSLRRSNVKQAS